jgi:hypothetical protein
MVYDALLDAAFLSNSLYRGAHGQRNECVYVAEISHEMLVIFNERRHWVQAPMAILD